MPSDSGAAAARGGPHDHPLFDVAVPLAEPHPNVPATPLNHDDWRSDKTLLLVEDDAQVRRFVADILHLLGYRVLEACDGREALQIHEEFSDAIDVLLTDVVMPHLSGPDLAGRLLVARPGIRIIYMSGYSFPSVVSPWSRTGQEEFIAKPFTMRTLLETLRRSGGRSELRGSIGG